MIINAEPMATGASAPALAPMTVMPTVMAKKNVPMNSTRYFFINLGSPTFAQLNPARAFFPAKNGNAEDDERRR
jgi:hypothetical protein